MGIVYPSRKILHFLLLLFPLFCTGDLLAQRSPVAQDGLELFLPLPPSAGITGIHEPLCLINAQLGAGYQSDLGLCAC